jgi:Uma2 family endonuclease
MSLTKPISLEIERISETPYLPPGSIYCPERPLTLEEFYELVDEDSKAELVDGVIIMPSYASTPHEKISSFLHVTMGGYVSARNLGMVLGSHSLVRITSYTGREPDVLFVRKERYSIITEKEITGAPDLIVEIISPDDFPREVTSKQAQYELIGVSELWLINLSRKRVTQLLLDANGRYQIAFQGTEGTLRCKVIEGFAIQVEWLWREPTEFPSEYEVLRGLLQD